ncbi:hypothetical protein V5O48_015362 [Marasmius crinis-equi]|uniref:Uncharacterized protein n=1 Tax=Marasmius crinis-equi TaxID=585013 RepID=A0ABR3EUR7_9AGAR
MHFKPNCTGGCMNGLTGALGIHQPAEDLPLGSIKLNDITAEAIFALGVRARPMVLKSCRCKSNEQHIVDVVWVGNRFKVKCLEKSPILPVKCDCPVWMFSWEPSESHCMSMGFHLWHREERDFRQTDEEHKDALRDFSPRGDGLTNWERQAVFGEKDRN